MIVTCAAPPTPPAIIVRRASQNPAAVRPVLRVARKPAPQQSTVRIICTEPPATGAAPGPMAPLMLPAAEVLPVVAVLPAVPAAPVEPLVFDPPRAGPAQTWTLAAAPPPAWLPVQPWGLPATLPAVPEPPVWALVLLGLGVMAWRLNVPMS